MGLEANIMIGLFFLLRCRPPAAAVDNSRPPRRHHRHRGARHVHLALRRQGDERCRSSRRDPPSGRRASRCGCCCAATPISRACARSPKRLFDKGVTRIEFVDPNGKPAFPFEPDPNLPRYTASGGTPSTPSGAAIGGWSEMRAREHSFLGRRGVATDPPGQVRRSAQDGARPGRSRRRRRGRRGVPRGRPVIALA